MQTQPALKSGSRSAAMRCRSIGCSGLVHSVHQSDQSFSGNRSGCQAYKHATANLRAKLKSPKLSSWEDSSPSRSTANNQKCSERSSRSLSPCPLSYSNPCNTSVYASHIWFTCHIQGLVKIKKKAGKKDRKKEKVNTLALIIGSAEALPILCVSDFCER